MIMQKILIIMGTYLPGRKGGGAVVSIENMTNALGDEYRFGILTSDRDIGDRKRYKNITGGRWIKVGKAKVKYVNPLSLSFSTILKTWRRFDVIYICGFFNVYTLCALILKKIGLLDKKIIVSPMGSLTYGAYSLKKQKKELWLKLCQKTGLLESINWAVTSELEKKEMLDVTQIPDPSLVYITPDIPKEYSFKTLHKSKDKGSIKIAWISRISAKKNLIGAIETLAGVSGDVHFDIYGPAEDARYMELCREKLKALPANIKWQEHGIIDAKTVERVFAGSHVFLFETLSENYGHVIYEALAHGCPCIISDKTPWLDLNDRGVGFCIDLDDKKGFCDALQYYINMDEEQFGIVSGKCVEYAAEHYRSRTETTAFSEMFR